MGKNGQIDCPHSTVLENLGKIAPFCTQPWRISVKESAWEGQVRNMGFVIFAKKMGIKDVDEQNTNPRKLLLLAQTGLKSKTSRKK